MEGLNLKILISEKLIDPLGSIITNLPYQSVINFDAKTLAQQLTLIESSIYKDVDRSELFEQSWNKEKSRYYSNNIRLLIHRTNRLSYWVATNIILHASSKNRVKAINLFIDVATELLNLKNYNSLMAIIAGLSIGPISRLNHTFSKVKKKRIKYHKTDSLSIKFL